MRVSARRHARPRSERRWTIGELVVVLLVFGLSMLVGAIAGALVLSRVG